MDRALPEILKNEGTKKGAQGGDPNYNIGVDDMDWNKKNNLKSLYQDLSIVRSENILNSLKFILNLLKYGHFFNKLQI